METYEWIQNVKKIINQTNKLNEFYVSQLPEELRDLHYVWNAYNEGYLKRSKNSCGIGS